MIYISSAAIRRDSLTEAVTELAKNGFREIELTAGNPLTENWLEELLEMKEKYQLRYLCHNYFPAPEEPFVLNLASQDQSTYQKSMQLAKRALEISAILGGDRYAIHAGFQLDIPVSQIGKRIDDLPLNEDKLAWSTFTNAVEELQGIAENVKLYIENNVLSLPNYESFKQKNPFYVTHFNAWNRLKNSNNSANLLLDVAHLKVTCQTLSLDFKSELERMALSTDYIHLSDNDGQTDTNQKISADTDWLKWLKDLHLSSETVYTVEVYGGIDDVRSSYDTIKNTLVS